MYNIGETWDNYNFLKRSLEATVSITTTNSLIILEIIEVNRSYATTFTILERIITQ